MSKTTKIIAPTTIVNAIIDGADVQFTFLGKPTKEHIEKTVQQTLQIQTQARANPFKGNMLKPKTTSY